MTRAGAVGSQDKTWLDLAREVFPAASDEELDYILWEHTGFPGFFMGDPIAECRRQLERYRDCGVACYRCGAYGIWHTGQPVVAYYSGFPLCRRCCVGIGFEAAKHDEGTAAEGSPPEVPSFAVGGVKSMEEQENTRAAAPRSLTDSDLEELDVALRAASPVPWTAARLDTDGHDAMAKYLEGTIRMGGERYFLVGGEHDDGKPADVCHTGNGPRSEANAHTIAALRNAAHSLISDSRALLEARRLLRGIRGMIAEDTTFPGAVLRVEIDAFLGERSDRERSSPPSPSAGPSETPQEGK